MADPREKGISQSREDNPMPEPLRVSSANELYQSMKQRLMVGKIDISDGLNTSTALGVFENPAIKRGPIYERPMTLLPQILEERDAAKEIKLNIAQMMIEVKTAAAHDLVVQTLHSSDSFPGLAHKIIPNKIKALRARDKLNQLELRIKSLEIQFENRLFSTKLVKAAQEELIILQSRGIQLTEQLISDTLSVYLGESPFLPADQGPPKIKKARGIINRETLITESNGITAIRTRRTSNVDTGHHFPIQAPVFNRSVSLLVLGSIALPIAACVASQSDKPILTVTPSGIDNEPDQSQQTAPSGDNGSTQKEDNSGQQESNPTPSAEPPGKNVAYPQDASNFKWNETDFSDEVMNILENPDSVYYYDTNNIEKFYKRVAESQRLDTNQINFVGSIGPDTWVIALKYQGKFFTLKQQGGLLISEITPFRFYNENPANYALVEITPPEGYSHNDLRLVQDESTYHLFATNDHQYYLDLTQSEWRSAVSKVEVMPTESAYNFEPGNWAEKEDGTFNPQVMYPLEGAIDKKHHNVVDLVYNGLQVAVVTNEDLSQKDAVSYADFKNNQATGINNNLDLKSQLDQVKSLIDQGKIDKYTVVIENGAIKWIVDQRGDYYTYHKLENGTLRQLSKEEEPQLLPKLEVRGNKFYRVDTDEVVNFAGIMIDMFPEQINKHFDTFNNLLDISKSLDSNIVRLPITMDGILKKDLESYKNILEIAGKKGIYVMFSTYSIYSGHNDFYDNHLSEVEYDIVYKALARLSTLSLEHNNLILDVWNEIPVPIGSKELNRIEQSIQAIININPDVPIGIPGGKWSRDFRYLRDNKLKDKYNNIFLHVHSNPWVAWNGKINDKGEEQYDYIEDVISWWSEFISEYPVLIGEWQMSDQFSQTEEEKTRMQKVNDIIKENGLSFTAYRFSPWNDKQYDLLKSFSESQPSFYLRGITINDLLQSYSQTQFDK